MSDLKGEPQEDVEPQVELPEGAPPTVVPPPRRHGQAAFAGAFAIAFVLFFATILPIIAPILLGALLAAFAAPLRVRVERRFGNRSVAAAAVTLLIILTGLVPLVFLSVVIAERVERLVNQLPDLLEWLGPGGGLSVFLADKPSLRRLVPTDLDAEISGMVSTVGGMIPSILTSFFRTAMGVFLTLVTLFYLLRDGRWVMERVELALPLEPRHTRAIVDEFQGVGRGVILGTLGTALAQGIVAGLGYWVIGLPEPLLLGVLTFVAAPIPLVGTALIWFPGAIGLMIAGETTRGAICIAYGALVVGTLDNILRPYLTGRGIHVHSLLVFLSLFGGILAFGPSGVFLGPLFVSLFIALAHIYEREMSPNASSPAGGRTPELSLAGKLKAALGKIVFRKQS